MDGSRTSVCLVGVWFFVCVLWGFKNLFSCGKLTFPHGPDFNIHRRYLVDLTAQVSKWPADEC